MTFRRYQALKQVWKTSPPVSMCLAAICKMLGMDFADETPEVSKSNDYFDEDYFGIATQTGAFDVLSREFNRVNGGE